MKQSQEQLITISKAARILGVPNWTLINWDRSGALPCTERSKGGHRRYYQSDIEKLRDQIDSERETRRARVEIPIEIISPNSDSARANFKAIREHPAIAPQVVSVLRAPFLSLGFSTGLPIRFVIQEAK